MNELREKNLRIYSGFTVTPEGWNETNVGEICDLGRGRVISQDEINAKPGQFPVFSSQTRNNGEMGRLATFDFSGEYVTWTTDGENAGTVFFRSGQFNCTNVCGTLRPKSSSDFDIRFLTYQLGSVAKRYVSYIGNPKLMNGVMASVGLILPANKQQQRRIAEILATVDEAIEQTEALVQKWQQMKAGLMHDLFTRGVTAAGQLRPTRQAAPQLYKEEPRFGWIPKEWQPDNFGNKIELVHGYQFRDYDFVEDGIPVVKIGQVTEDGLDLSSCSFVSRDRLNSFQEIQIKQGDVLMALTGATLGKTCMVEETDTDLLQNYRVGRFEPREPETVHKGFLFALLGFSKIRRQIFDKVNSGAQGNVGKADFERVRICLPPYDEQLLIHKRIDAFQRKIKTECLAVAKLRTEKQGLMQDLLTGRKLVTLNE